MKWKCPICTCPDHASIDVVRPDGSLYRTDFFRCAACSMMFMEPELANRDTIDAFGTDGFTPQMAHDHSLLNQALTYRYWAARLKRQKGGQVPKSEDVVRAITSNGRSIDSGR